MDDEKNLKTGEEEETLAAAQEQDTTEEANTPEGEEEQAAETAESPENDPEEENEAQPAEEKAGFFSRKKKEDKEKAALKEKVGELEDKVMRQMAEFDNFRKRTDKEKDQMFQMGEKNVLEKILPILDNFERGFDTVQPDDEEDAFTEGMRKIYQQLVKQLEDLGVTPIEAQGKPFDPNLHNAVMQTESDELESGTVAQELQKGYMFHDTVLRHSMVSVVS